MGWYSVGVDLGQSRDFTAIAVLERAELVGEWDAVAFAHRKLAALRLRFLERIPLGTAGTPKDVAEAVAFLASEEARYITGQVLGVDGGMGLG